MALWIALQVGFKSIQPLLSSIVILVKVGLAALHTKRLCSCQLSRTLNSSLCRFSHGQRKLPYTKFYAILFKFSSRKVSGQRRQ